MGQGAAPQSTEIYQKGIHETCEIPKQETEILERNTAAYSPLPSPATV